ncbi:MAG: DUF4198 domain-containing protein [Deltaproteobacteria bacterium]|jgi:uncharacterized GH25 family protein|nr:DUF4198 domain-containing protein [Deltaproteobacteria bacterium]
MMKNHVKESNGAIRDERNLPKSLSLTVFVLAFTAAAVITILLGTGSLLAHSLWVEAPENPAKDEPVKVDIGFNDLFEPIAISDSSVSKISAPTVIGVNGEILTKLSGGANYEYVTETPLSEGGYLAYVEYEPFLSARENEPNNRFFMTGKHIINIGASNDELITKPQGKTALELVTLANPKTLKAGGSLPLQVYYDGKPLAGAEVYGDYRGFNPPGSWGLAKAFYCKADKEGKLDFIPAKGGLWMLKVRNYVPNEDTSEAAQTVHVHTLTFYVAE